MWKSRALTECPHTRAQARLHLGGLQGLQTTGREIYAWGNSQSLLASETSGKDRDGICLGIGRLDMSTCKLAAVTRHMGNLILFAGKKNVGWATFCHTWVLHAAAKKQLQPR